MGVNSYIFLLGGHLLPMPKVTAQGKTFECEYGSNLRKVLLDNNIDLYNGNAKIINCMSIGTCGTCAVAIQGEVSEPNWKEKARLGLPPLDTTYANVYIRPAFSLAFQSHDPQGYLERISQHVANA